MVRDLVLMAALALVGTTGEVHAQARGDARGEDPGGPAATVVDLVGVVRRADAVAAALTGNPDLVAAAWELRASDARVVAGARRPDPEIQLLVEDVLGTGQYAGVGGSQTTLEVRQLVELGGKRAARIDVAERGRELTAAERAFKMSELTAEAARRFVRVLAAQNLIALARGDEARTERTVGIVSERVRVGAGSPLEQERAVVVRERAHIAAEHAEHVLAVARQELAATWGRGKASFERVEGDLFEVPRVPGFEVLAARLGSAPELARAAQDRRLREAQKRLAAARRVPDVSVSGGVRRLQGPGAESFLFSVSVPLPFSNRNAGALAEARALMERSVADREAVGVRLRTLLFALYQELQHAGIELAALEERIVPGAERSVALARRAFAQGQATYLELADTERAFAEARRERIEVAARRQEQIIEIERLIGGSIDAGLEGAR